MPASAPGAPTLIPPGGLNAALAQLEAGPRPEQPQRQSRPAAQTSGFSGRNSGQLPSRHRLRSEPSAEHFEQQPTNAVSNVTNASQPRPARSRTRDNRRRHRLATPKVIVTQGRFLREQPYLRKHIQPRHARRRSQPGEQSGAGVGWHACGSGRHDLVPGRQQRAGPVRSGQDRQLQRRDVVRPGKGESALGGLPTVSSSPTCSPIPAAGNSPCSAARRRPRRTSRPRLRHAKALQPQRSRATSPLRRTRSAAMQTAKGGGRIRGRSTQPTPSTDARGSGPACRSRCRSPAAGRTQKSYMGVFVADYGTDTSEQLDLQQRQLRRSPIVSAANQEIGRLASHTQATADTGQGSAIYGSNGQYHGLPARQDRHDQRRGRPRVHRSGARPALRPTSAWPTPTIR